MEKGAGRGAIKQVQNFIDQTEQQRERDKVWKQSLEDNLLNQCIPIRQRH